MKDLKEYKNVMKISKERITDYENSLGDLSISYGETYVDFMLSSTSNDIFLRIDEDNGKEDLYLVSEDDAPQYKKMILQELVKYKTIAGKTIDIDNDIKKTDTETIINLISLEGKETKEIGEIISDIIIECWPYILGEKTIEKTQDDFEINNLNNNVDSIIEESNDNNTLILDNGELLENNADYSQGKIYIQDNLPKINRRTRLIRRIIGNSSYQLFFQLPDMLEHYVDITCMDTSGIIDSLSTIAKNQFRYLIFPKSPDSSVYVSVMVDGFSAYNNEFRIPYHLRSTEKRNEYEGDIFGVSVPSQSIIETNDTDIIKNNIDLGIDIDSSIVSKEAVKFLKGE